jgi:thiamine-phosphate pyrophosphorylase
VTPPAIEPAAFAPLLATAFDAADVAALRLRLPARAPDSYARALDAILKPAQARGVAVIVDADPRWRGNGAATARMSRPRRSPRRARRSGRV